MSDDIRREEDRPRRHRDDEDEDDRPRRRRRRRDDDDEDEDDERRFREDGDFTGGVIPYKNPKALIAYYLGVFSLIPCVGLLLGPAAIVLGILGLLHVKKHPTNGGTAHALVGLIVGSLVTVLHIIAIIVIFLFAGSK
jgi:hypothetical protein